MAEQGEEYRTGEVIWSSEVDLLKSCVNLKVTGCESSFLFLLVRSMHLSPLLMTNTGIGGKSKESVAGGEEQGMSTAEQRVSCGFPVGNPSGVNPTPSTEQVAQAKSLAGGKV